MSISGRCPDCLKEYFRFYDEDDSGGINLEEMTRMSRNIYELDGVAQVIPT